ncbi:MAG: 1,4-dihydroxy-2-naphthoate polyprenyltransferase [Stygiobacter sp. RIFOXYC12_FULL_38_8]|nr:MAG: 1,4-dihydroxy-2-naphthoate polyprenyltransferase [Stygiobacter sp. RIFOXYB2_FULL_37_11]OGV14568.1 MAG: 1,4-dihydroxy-2-naphthoate polyprenyltransferase [Stygiobacter sp. RIFOXYC2_FULL_38_25]OGV17081.1 MAG: 1,4-dihydroxy-2-naphthoate polyprenyltransferase [Stygiobacter sp. RIFOXYA2_FULL_38_8]OGV29277.1 MAG: 1,4-dihydroxy-2-naphthoate polyprenyltransferase [Stygiobacter sp. RIFOXYC12_FULL_38_8]OGV81448.1 MAG: 1,4-dihydroxy-2-naphthoate polyprenyltransferase [Stygiobacter sp. GWF2_38_21]R
MIQQQANTITKFDAWVLATRPRTLPAALVPVLVGSSIAINDGMFKPLAAIVALVCAILIQIGTNFVNDLYDFLHGTDKKDRIGPKRVVTSGLISIPEMKLGIIFVFGLSFVLGMYLVHLAGWEILLLGVISILAGIAYTAGPFPLAYNGLGDIASFLFFGLIGTVGTYYVQANEISPFAFWSSIPVGALITNILVVNNYRDREEDQSNGKNTLAVLLGEKFARLQYVFFMIVSYAILFVVYFTYKNSAWVFLPLISLPLSVKLIKMIFTLRGRELNKTLELTAKLSALYGLLFAAGILI